MKTKAAAAILVFSIASVVPGVATAETKIVVVSDAACRDFRTISGYLISIQRGDYSRPLPGPPECIDLPEGTKVRVGPKRRKIENFGWFRRIEFMGSKFWFGESRLDKAPR